MVFWAIVNYTVNPRPSDDLVCVREVTIPKYYTCQPSGYEHRVSSVSITLISIRFSRGKFAVVRKCTHKVTGIEYAAKFIRKRRRSMDQRNDIYHEIAVLKLAQNCGHIVNIHEVYETPTEMALVLELVAGGELQRVIDENEGLEEMQTIHILQKILKGLKFLHTNNIAHLDLKPQNLLITSSSSFPHCDIKLCDFGISRVIEQGIEVREMLGTPDYVAPEVLNYEPISLSTDIWSVGVLAYVLLSGYSPFAGDTKQETFCNIAQCSLSFPPELFDNVSDYAKDFIMVTLVPDGSQRLTVDECLLHPWLNNFPVPTRLNVLLPSEDEDEYNNGLDVPDSGNESPPTSRDLGETLEPFLVDPGIGSRSSLVMM